MQTEYSEITMIGRFRLIKGFVHGYFLGKSRSQRPFFHMKSGTIRHDTLLGGLKAFLEMENRVPFCIENSMIPDFKKAVDVAYRRFGIYIKEIKKIKSAEFRIVHKIYNPQIGAQCKEIFSALPKGVEVTDYEPVEETHKDSPEMAFKGASHKYEYSGRGIIRGAFEPVIDTFFAIKQSSCSEFIECHHLKLNFE